MKKNLLNLLYNPSSISSVTSDARHTRPDHVGANDYHILEALENLALAKTESDIFKHLENLKMTLSWGLSKGIQNILLKQFHLFLCRVTREYVDSVEMFQICCDLLEDIKRLLGDKECLIQESLWVELEKSVYVLSLWQNCGSGQDILRFH